MNEEIIIRSDLIIENLESSENVIEKEKLDHESKQVDNLTITEVTIRDDQEELFNKKAGSYVTIDTSAIIENDHEQLLKIQKHIGSIINKILQKYDIKKEDLGMVVGLGNDQVTPDALGPSVIDDIFVTKHIFDLHPESINPDGFRPVCAISPGVMGTTGVETAEIIDSIVKRVNPDFLIVVDALAARNVKRLNTTIQISDAGINPGSGIGNNRKGISHESMGIPVISVGVPTVVDAVAITSDTIDIMIKHIGYSLKNDRPASMLTVSGMKTEKYTEDDRPKENTIKNLFGSVGALSQEQKKKLILEALSSQGLNMMVTPKEIDTNIADLTHIISRGINLALHEQIS